MQENQVSGIILMGTVMTPLILQAARECRVPVVITGQNCAGVPCVYHDDFLANAQFFYLFGDFFRYCRMGNFV